MGDCGADGLVLPEKRGMSTIGTVNRQPRGAAAFRFTAGREAEGEVWAFLGRTIG